MKESDKAIDALAHDPPVLRVLKLHVLRRFNQGIAEIAGVADRTGWCPIDPVTFESKLVPNIPRLWRRRDSRFNAEIAFVANAQAERLAVSGFSKDMGRPFGAASFDFQVASSR
jgi:hypothetical protein